MHILLNQFDPAWANVKIGASSLTLGRYGCTITSLCMALSDFGIYILPDELARQTNCFTPGGLVLWKKVENWLRLKFPRKIFSLTRYYGRNDQAIVQSLKPGSGVLLEVANGSHWLKANRKMLWRNDYNCSDPWGGVGRSAIGDYKSITGFAVLKIT